MCASPADGPLRSDESASSRGDDAAARGLDLGSAYRGALRWVRSHSISRLDGAADSDPRLEPSLGQLASTLLECGERRVAERALARLLEMQRSDGSWPGSAALPPARETADAVRGLLAVLPSRPDSVAAIRRACEWLLGPWSRGLSWAQGRDTTTRLAVAAALDAASGALDESRLRAGAQALGDGEGSILRTALRATLGVVRVEAHTHQDRVGFLLDLGRPDAVDRVVREAERKDRKRIRWCATCAAQLVSAGYRLGRRQPADRVLAELVAVQDGSGALPETVGPGAGPVHASAAGTRELLEAIHRHVEAAFALQVDGFEDRIRAGDGRFAFLLREAGALSGRHVLDAGCGRGAITRALLTACPSAAIVAMDLSPEMLWHAPPAVETRRGSIQCLPFADGVFDVALCVEALEHALNPEGAVGELCRVVRPGGTVLIVDKNAERMGALAIEAWERWFDRREVESWLRSSCEDVRSDLLVHCPELGRDLFIGWRGTRR
jgi:malonyl-CoA O-methyltransferase